LKITAIAPTACAVQEGGAMRTVRLVLVGTCAAAVIGCGGEIDSGVSVSQTQEGLSGCAGKASSTIPSSGNYYLTSFGFSPSDDGLMSCGQKTLHGSWYYAASRQRYGCGAHIQIEANGKCAVAETDDYGPDVCVENAAGRPIIDASPLVSQYLFGTKSAGWSDRFPVHVTLVAKTTALGPCNGQPPPPPPSPTPASCSSATLDRSVASGTCVQSASNGAWYTCNDGTWIAGATNCTIRYAWCHSDTLGRDLPARTCVESRFDGVWYQCGASGWTTPVTNGAGPVGTCSAEYSL
jgi:hypothetical protein